MKTVLAAVTITVVGFLFFHKSQDYGPITQLVSFGGGPSASPARVLIWGSPEAATPHLQRACSSSPLICSRFTGGLAVWSGRRLLPFHPHGSQAAEEPFTFHQALAPGGRAAGAAGMNQWMPYRPRGARPCKRGGGEDAGKDAYWATHHLTRLGQARIPGAGRGAPNPPTPPPLPGWRGLPALIVQAAGTSWEGELA